MASKVSISDLLDRAVEKLPFLRRVVTKRRFARNPEYRAAVLDEIALKLVDDPRAVELLGVGFCDTLCSGEATVETAFFEVDKIDNLERILKIIVEYLPQILAIVMKLFAASILFLALAFMTSSANAQHWTYPGDLGSHLQSTHGVSTAGLSREQMLNLHDALHEGRGYQTSGRAYSKTAYTQRRFAPLRFFRR